MKFVVIDNHFVVEDLTDFYETIESARFDHPYKFIVDAPNYVFPGWIYDSQRVGDARFIKPAVPKGWAYDDETGTFYNLTANRNEMTADQLHLDHIAEIINLANLSNRADKLEKKINDIKEGKEDVD